MQAPKNLWSTTLTAAPSSAPALWDNRIVCPVQASAQAESQARLELLSLDDGRHVWQRASDHALISGLAVANDVLLVSLTSTDFLRGEGALLAAGCQRRGNLALGAGRAAGFRTCHKRQYCLRHG